MPVSKTRPGLAFIKKASKPNMVGVVPVGSEQGAWYSKEHIENYIKKLQKELEFWQELLAQFD